MLGTSSDAEMPATAEMLPELESKQGRGACISKYAMPAATVGRQVSEGSTPTAAIAGEHVSTGTLAIAESPPTTGMPATGA